MSAFARSYDPDNYDRAKQTIADTLGNLSNLSPRDAVGLCDEILSRVLDYGVSYADFQSAKHAQSSIRTARNALRRVS